MYITSIPSYKSDKEKEEESNKTTNDQQSVLDDNGF